VENNIDSLTKEMDELHSKINKLSAEIVTLSKEDLITALDKVISKNLRDSESLESLNSIKRMVLFFGTVSVCLMITFLLITLFTVPA
jgi:hypothetical protein